MLLLNEHALAGTDAPSRDEVPRRKAVRTRGAVGIEFLKGLYSVRSTS